MTGFRRNHIRRLARALAASSIVLVLVAGLAGCSDDDSTGDNNNANVNANDNGNSNTNSNTNNNGCGQETTRCVGSVLETCDVGTWGAGLDCASGGQICRADLTTGEAICDDVAWVWRTVEIDDPIMVGSSLNTPIDGISFGYDAAEDRYVTSFGRDINDPTQTHLWQVDGTDGTHAKQALTGTVFGPAEGFCMGSEDWCQFVGFDEVNAEWVVLGVSTSSVMRVGSTWAGSLEAITGTHAPDNWISHSHRFAWSARQLYLFGATGPSGFSDTVYAFDLDANSWTTVAMGLPQSDQNCLAYDSTNDLLLSVGGRVTTDGGNTTTTVDSLLTIDPVQGTYTRVSLPNSIGARQSMSCAYDPGRQVLYVYGGSVVNDRFNEALNVYHNDLWALDLTLMSWTPLIPDTESGTLNPPDSYGDQSFEGFPEGPNFGKNRGHLLMDPTTDRLLISGAVPIFTHEQLYWLRLEGVDQLL